MNNTVEIIYNKLASYIAHINVRNLHTNELEKTEYINFRSLPAARYYADKFSHCVDVINTIVVDSETGEVMAEYENGKCTYISE